MEQIQVGVRNDRPAFNRGGGLGSSPGCLYYEDFWRLCAEGDGRTEDGWHFSQKEPSDRQGLIPTGLWLSSNATEEEEEIDYTGLIVNPKDVNKGGSPVCSAGHPMAISTFAGSGYDTGWFCNTCNFGGSETTPRWFCQSCTHDICTNCIPEKGSQQTSRQRDPGGCELVAALKPCGFAQTKLRRDWSPLNLADGADVEIAVRASVFLSSPDLGGVDSALLPFFGGNTFGGFGSSGNQQQFTQLTHCRGVVSRTGEWLGNSRLIEVKLPDGLITISDTTPAPEGTGFSSGSNGAPWDVFRNQQTVILANLDPAVDRTTLERAINTKLNEAKDLGIGKAKIDESMAALVAMGFDHNRAAAALLLAEYDTNEAASMLMENPTRVDTAVVFFCQQINTTKPIADRRWTSDGILMIDPHNDPRPVTQKLFQGSINMYQTADKPDAAVVRAELAGEKCSGCYAAVRCQSAEQAFQIEAVMKGAMDLHNRPMKSCLGPSLFAVGRLAMSPANEAQQQGFFQGPEKRVQVSKSEALAVGLASGSVAYVSTLDLSLPRRVFRDACRKLWSATPEILVDRRVCVMDSESGRTSRLVNIQERAETQESLFVSAYIGRYSKHLLVSNAENPSELSCELSDHISRSTREIIPFLYHLSVSTRS